MLEHAPRRTVGSFKICLKSSLYACDYLGLSRHAIEHTKAYLSAFEDELTQAKDSVALIAAMKARYPGLGMEVALDIGAKVATGEMKWG